MIQVRFMCVLGLIRRGARESSVNSGEEWVSFAPAGANDVFRRSLPTAAPAGAALPWAKCSCPCRGNEKARIVLDAGLGVQWWGHGQDAHATLFFLFGNDGLGGGEAGDRDAVGGTAYVV